jgi:NAD-dependent deacetylase
MYSPRVAALLADPRSRITVLTGAGVSAESGIPTFRGPEGYWTVGSSVYTPREMATRAMFRRNPEAVWSWYLYRFTVCLEAQPNRGHAALAAMERRLGDRFTLITQNIDGLHLRAGNSPERTLQIHGSIRHVRCADGCARELLPLDPRLARRRPSPELARDELGILRCRGCGGWLRPHVLWFDEYYDEEYYRAESAVAAAARTDVLVIAGTSGATTLPNHVAAVAHGRGAVVLDINLEPSPFSALAGSTPGGGFIRARSSEALAELAGLCGAAAI